jgi:hypothetical protein
MKGRPWLSIATRQIHLYTQVYAEALTLTLLAHAHTHFYYYYIHTHNAQCKNALAIF